MRILIAEDEKEAFKTIVYNYDANDRNYEGKVIYFIIEISPETDLNPFKESLLIDLQLIPNKKPLLKFRKDCFIHKETFC